MLERQRAIALALNPWPVGLDARGRQAEAATSSGRHTDRVPQFLIPIDGLSVEADLIVGPITVGPGPAALALLRSTQPDRALLEHHDSIFKDVSTTAFAVLSADDRESAFEQVAVAVDLLRLYQHVRYWDFPIGQFALAGDLGHGVLPFGQIEDGRGGQGWIRRGQHLGWTFKVTDQWGADSPFARLAESIGDPDLSEGARRALTGIHYVSQAIAIDKAAFKIVALVTALEAWLLPRRGTAKTFRLARAVSFFGCGRHDSNLCGRTRDTCPYLALDPGRDADRRQLRHLRSDGHRPPWLCSEWHRVVDWYDLRSDVVHGDGCVVDSKEASSALFWVIRYLTEPILDWLETHAHDPIGALEQAIAQLPAAPDWEARLGPLTRVQVPPPTR